MDRLADSAHLMLVSDLDDTMVDHQDPQNLSLLRFNSLWESEYRENSVLVFSTGRSPNLYRKLRNEIPVLTPDITVLSVGTVILYGEKLVRDEDWIELLDENWDRNVVLEETDKFPQLKSQSEMDQGPHKVSFYISKEDAEQVINPLLASLSKRGLDVKIIYSGGIALDVLPKRAGKGEALNYLLNKFNLNKKAPINTLVCGDSGNDAELFIVRGVYGVMVKNAKEELLEWYKRNKNMYKNVMHATERCAAGILQSIGQFKLGPNISPRDINISFSYQENNNNINNNDNRDKPACFTVKFYLLCERWYRAEIQNSENFIIHLKNITNESGVIVHPSGKENSLHETVDILNSCYGNKKGMSFRIWLDKVLVSQIGTDCWLVRFNKWEVNDGSKKCCANTVLLNSNGEMPGGFCISHVHQTWHEECPTEGQQLLIF
ncbi:hypothetical protein LUZ60_013133 [Juncus effusus]|nr:hypothetical protein LUZ60_013133 [Juncus effusus]